MTRSSPKQFSTSPVSAKKSSPVKHLSPPKETEIEKKEMPNLKAPQVKEIFTLANDCSLEMNQIQWEQSKVFLQFFCF